METGDEEEVAVRYDREIPLIDLAPAAGDTKKLHQICLVCAYPTHKKRHIEEKITKIYTNIFIQQLSQEGKTSIIMYNDDCNE